MNDELLFLPALSFAILRLGRDEGDVHLITHLPNLEIKQVSDAKSAMDTHREHKIVPEAAHFQVILDLDYGADIPDRLNELHFHHQSF